MDPRRHPDQVIPSPEISRISLMVWRPMMETPHQPRRAFVIQSSAGGRGPSWHRGCPPSFPMNTSHPDTTQLVPALEQALDRVPSAAIPVLIGDLERLQALLSARLLREAWQAAPHARGHSSLEDLQHLTPAQVA
jgi:hypothetical protein